ncbi:metallopeptidase family protein [Agathobaculum sp.]|uniref:metallopeptidase family protein n=1 Tax=Agathobaculum sp. TaxID=2048138 RepID=UPI002A810BF6|nr:metallopeptidase family protein [Agathobaculum sp.]MDY3617854.1 metallopeptidase family protein [Agathobaculum sp.]
MISIDEFEAVLDELADELPAAFYEELNGGILVDPGCPLHPESVNGDLYIMGEYRTDPAMGKYIVMFYGSFHRVFGGLPEEALREEMRRVLRHEFRHHVEGRAGMRDLEVWDEEQIAAYRAGHE